MKRRNKLLFVGVGILLLLGALGVTVMNASAEFVTPTAVDDGDYEGEWVNLEGQATDIEQTGEKITFAISDNNTSVDVVYEGTMPETMAENRIVVAKGAVEDGTLQATELSVRAHNDEDGDPPEEHT
ncbi:cytochrome c maturation protein CcmE domain-containing protein [Natronorubrum thiooxidans]|uniref:cytochrome c maturation protein CcmE domain-containing protein n=1 Tax=Natronorubrum thiooxidans TaxID=308853 RepID=UPI0009715E06|nr:cytochrome c maturation protein CcmE [Natronorubrum thiooxidans]